MNLADHYPERAASLLRRSVDLEVRGLDEGTRTATFTATTERGVDMGAGVPEVLRMSGADLRRYRKNPVVLDSHRLVSTDDVIGRAKVKVEGRELVAEVTFADDEKSDRIWRKVRGGFLRAMSIGYTVDLSSVRELQHGEHDGRGEHRVDGPALIANRWTLHEVSVVPVPADEDAVRRSFYAALPPTTSPEPKEDPVSEPETRAAEPESAPVVNADAIAAQREAEILEARGRAQVARHALIRGFTPADMADYLDGLLLEDPEITPESARRALLDERKRRMAPVGTPEPAVEAAPTTTTKAAPVDSAAIARALGL